MFEKTTAIYSQLIS